MVFEPKHLRHGLFPGSRSQQTPWPVRLPVVGSSSVLVTELTEQEGGVESYHDLFSRCNYYKGFLR